jgi:hypothetical protein
MHQSERNCPTDSLVISDTFVLQNLIPRHVFSDSSYVNQTQLAERELSAFIGAVTKLFINSASSPPNDRFFQPFFRLFDLHTKVSVDTFVQ